MNTLPNSTEQPPPQKEKKEHIRSTGVSPTVFRDIAIIIASLFVGNLPITFHYKYLPPMGIFDLMALGFYFSMLILGFALVGYLAHGNRWRQLVYVTLGVWLIAVFAAGLTNNGRWIWVFTIFFAVTMPLGGALSYAFRRKDRKP